MLGKPVTRVPGTNIKSPPPPTDGPRCPKCGRSIIEAYMEYDPKLKRTVLKCPCGHIIKS